MPKSKPSLEPTLTQAAAANAAIKILFFIFSIPPPPALRFSNSAATQLWLVYITLRCVSAADTWTAHPPQHDAVNAVPEINVYFYKLCALILKYASQFVLALVSKKHKEQMRPYGSSNPCAYVAFPKVGAYMCIYNSCTSCDYSI